MNKKEKLLKIHRFLYHSALKRVRIVILFLPAFIFLTVFLLIGSINQSIKVQTQVMKLPPPLFPDFHPGRYPFLRSSIPNTIPITAQGAIVMDSDSKVILYVKNPDTRFSMASSTKIMTALVGMDYYRPTAILTMRSANVPPAIVGYGVGEKVTFANMLYGLLLPSGNDAALAVAQNYPNGEKAFINVMNKKAKELSLFNTQFADSSGLDDRNYTTVVDLAHLASFAIKNPEFKKIVSTKQKMTTNAEKTKTFYVSNLNELLGKYGVNGIKTGFTPTAGGILVTSTVQNGHTLIVVVMKSEDRFGDTEKLLSQLSGNVTYLSILP